MFAQIRNFQRVAKAACALDFFASMQQQPARAELAQYSTCAV